MAVRSSLIVVLGLAVGLAGASAKADDCAAEAAKLARAEAELPRLDLTPPLHWQLVCITLETLVAFARRVGTHVGQCPASPYAGKAATFEQMHADNALRFRQYRCRRTM